MPYTTSPYQPKLRRDVAAYAHRHGVRPASRHFGIPPGTISKWVQRSRAYGYHPIPTKSSRPKSHPKQLSDAVVREIIRIRLANNRTSEVVHQELMNMGVLVSLNSVRRTIDRHGLMKKRSPWKRYHPPVERPYPTASGVLVELDSIHLMTDPKHRIYVLTLIDVYSRVAYARAYERMNGRTAVAFARAAQRALPFRLQMLQSDHGPEFSSWFVARVPAAHRYTRVGKPNDNAHIERFNRTIQEECLDKIPRDVRMINSALRSYLPYYNTKRLHLGISLKTPIQLVT